ncbi:hypothetical protein R84B8_00502 [Treponema sp. R8-4-B8]
MKKNGSKINTETKEVKKTTEIVTGKKLCLSLLFIFLLFLPFSTAAAQNEDGVFSLAAFLQKGQNVSNLYLFSEKDPATYAVFYAPKSTEVYFVREEDIFSSSKLVCKFGPGIKLSGTPAFALLLNITTGNDMLTEENLESIGILAWANLTRTGNADIPYVLTGAFIPKDAKSKQIFQLLVLGKLKEVQ